MKVEEKVLVNYPSKIREKNMKQNTKNTNLYHFTNGLCIKDILKYGIIFGDVMTTPGSGFNSPNLTENSNYHLPSGASQNLTDELGMFRLTIELNKNDKNLMNYAYFDKKYANGIHHELYNNETDGYLKEQWIYLDHIKTSTFTNVSVWDKRINKWVSVNESEITNITKNIKRDNHISLTRLIGTVFNDKTGIVKKYYKETDDLTTNLGELYFYSDYVVRILQKKALKNKKHSKRFLNYKLDLMECTSLSDFKRVVFTKYLSIDPHFKKINKFDRYN